MTTAELPESETVADPLSLAVIVASTREGRLGGTVAVGSWTTPSSAAM